ncbi:C39 family peptidase [Deinococcus sp. QL22]|uniref:C39 family peptidase n=1 Tax=Deinococcus sp. QL22 TaxID=2939437 RepID=UPI0020171D1E|nr:C39 family peptidase [Deinococcus sp. QL22]UQN09581.1 C39 family peptidase [Deinococcus sp. QL22]
MTFSRWWSLALYALGSLASAAPASATLGNIRHEYQRLNNCGPVTALTLLNYYGNSVTQTQAAAVLKDGPNDPQVSSLELAAYLGRFGLQSVIRYAGDADLIRELVSRGLPVVVQQRLKPGSTVAHFRTVYGYSAGRFLVSDPLRGPSLSLTTAEFTELWRYYNGEYLVTYPLAKEALVREILGSDWNVTANWQHAKLHGEEDTKARPSDPFAWWGLGKANLRLGNFQAAAANFDRAVQLGVPTPYYVYRQEAFEAWTRAGQHQKTLTWTQRGLKVDPASKELLRFRNLASEALRG